MLQFKLLSLVLSAIFVARGCEGIFHTFSRGSCPSIESMPDFEMQRFLGEWFIIEQYNDFPVHCLRENFTKTQPEIVVPKKKILADADGDDDHIERKSVDMARMMNDVLESKKRSSDSSSTDSVKAPENVEHEFKVTRSYFSIGEQKVIKEIGQVKFNGTQDRMEIDYPYSETGMLNLRNYQVLMTDYDNYALVWRCQKTVLGHRRSAQIMSRAPELEKDTQVELQAMLRQLEMDKNMRVQKIRQNNCEKIEQEVSEADKPKIDISGLFEQNPKQSSKAGNKKKLLSIDIGGFHLSLSLPFFA